MSNRYLPYRGVHDQPQTAEWYEMNDPDSPYAPWNVDALDEEDEPERAPLDPPGTSTQGGESTAALMQRTDPVGYQQCRDAGRLP